MTLSGSTAPANLGKPPANLTTENSVPPPPNDPAAKAWGPPPPVMPIDLALPPPSGNFPVSETDAPPKSPSDSRIPWSPPPPVLDPMVIPRSSIPTAPPSNSDRALVGGLTVGISAIVILTVATVLFICHRKIKIKIKNQRLIGDYPDSPPQKDNYYAALPQHLKQKRGARLLAILAKPFGPAALSYQLRNKNQFSPPSPPSPLGLYAVNFTYEELEEATGGFSEATLLGEGGFGYIHRGILPNGNEIAVKQLKAGSRQGEREFQAEVETLSRVNHKHLVSLVGYCIAGAKRLLVYEFVPNNTLEFHLHGKGQPVMDWETRLRIAVGSAKGLAYLHEDCNPTVIHRDIKAANILLDSKFEAKVSDFGLAKFFSDADHVITHVSTRVVGTFGYLAPEYASSGKASYKSDVYSFGVVLLELITGRRPIDNTTESLMDNGLVFWARRLLMETKDDNNYEALIDPRLQRNYDNKQMDQMIACASACVRQSAGLRPGMSQIVRALEGDVPVSSDEGTKPGQSTVCESDQIFDFERFKANMMLETQENV